MEYIVNNWLVWVIILVASSWYVLYKNLREEKWSRDFTNTGYRSAAHLRIALGVTIVASAILLGISIFINILNYVSQ